MEQWKEGLSHVFGKRSRKKWKTVAVDILLVDHGVKKAYLFDQWSCSKNELESLLMNLHKRQLIWSRLGILSVDCDLLIFSLQHLQSSLFSELQILVDVSSTLDQPHVMHGERAVQYSATCQVFHDFLQSTSQKITEVPKISSVIPDYEYEIHISNAVNPPCLFGLALGYPVVYWYDRKEGDDNCLEMQPLRLYLIKGCERNNLENLQRIRCDYVIANQLKESPHALKLKLDQLKETRHTAAQCLPSKTVDFEDKLADKSQSEHCSSSSFSQNHTLSFSPDEKLSSNPHLIYSFSVPENVHTTDVKAHVEDWFAIWRFSAPWPLLFSEVWMEEKLVQPQAVCL